MDGGIRISHRLDNSIRSALKAAVEFNGDVLHRDNIGKTTDELVEIWNADHPDDQIVS